VNWTTHTPTEEGYYWFRFNSQDPTPTIMRLERDVGSSEMMTYERGSDIPVSPCTFGGEWLGPIKP